MKHLILTCLFLGLAPALFAQNTFPNSPKSHYEMVKIGNEVLPSLPKANQKTSGFLQKLDRTESLFWNDNTQNYFKMNELTYWYLPNSAVGKYQLVSYKQTNNPISYGRQYVYEYSADTTVHTQIRLMIDTLTGNWNTYSKWEIYYNTAKDMDYFDYFNWNETTLSWDITHRYEYNYSNAGKIELVEGYSWDLTNSNWVDSYKETTMYDANGWDTLYQEFNYDSGNNSWILEKENQYEYDSNGNMTKETWTWNISSGNFQTQKWENTFDAQNKMISKDSYLWNGPTMGWTKFGIQEYTYDSFDDVVLTENFSEDGGTWNITRKTNTSYDITVPASDLVLPNTPRYHNQFLEAISKNWESNTWENFSKKTYYYSDFDPVSVKDLTKEQSSAIPNPFNANISFNLSTPNENYYVEIFDALGKRVIAQAVFNQQKVDTHNLGTGFYFYTLTSKQGTTTGKLIKH